MTAGSIFRASARNNAWANYRLHEACARLMPSEFHATRTSFFPTIMKTFNHILIVDWLYIDSLECGGRGLKTVADDEPDPGLIVDLKGRAAADAFIAAVSKHRHFARETDPPRV